MKAVVRSAMLGAMVLAAWPLAAQTVRQRPPGGSGDAPRAERNDRAAEDEMSRFARDSGGAVAAAKTVGPAGGSTAFDAKFEDGMAAIRASNPGKAMALMRPVLAGFERQYAGEKRQIYCAVTPEQAAAYRADAARANRDAVTIDDDWCRAQYVNGYALIDLQRYAEAQAAFERLVGFAPQSSRYLNELAYTLMKQKKWKESLEIYRRSEAAADLSPDRAKAERCLALKGMGYNLVELGDLNAAEAAYRKCLNIDPTDTDSPGELEYIQKQRTLTV